MDSQQHFCCCKVTSKINENNSKINHLINTYQHETVNIVEISKKIRKATLKLLTTPEFIKTGGE